MIEGWQLVPKEPTREMLDAMPTLPAIQLPVPDVERGLMPSQVQNRTRYLAALAAAPKAILHDNTVRSMIDWLHANATAETDPKAKAAFVEAHNALLKIAGGRA